MHRTVAEEHRRRAADRTAEEEERRSLGSPEDKGTWEDDRSSLGGTWISGATRTRERAGRTYLFREFECDSKGKEAKNKDNARALPQASARTSAASTAPSLLVLLPQGLKMVSQKERDLLANPSLETFPDALAVLHRADLHRRRVAEEGQAVLDDPRSDLDQGEREELSKLVQSAASLRGRRTFFALSLGWRRAVSR